MSILNTARTGIAATNNMTLFSYILSKLSNENFKEADLLMELLEEHHVKKEYADVIAWAGHYALGILFAAACDIAWKNKKDVKITDGILPGAAFGVLAVVVWRTILKEHPLALRTRHRAYYRQLFIAHVIFGMTVAMKQENRSR